MTLGPFIQHNIHSILWASFTLLAPHILSYFLPAAPLSFLSPRVASCLPQRLSIHSWNDRLAHNHKTRARARKATSKPSSGAMIRASSAMMPAPAGTSLGGAVGALGPWAVISIGRAIFMVIRSQVGPLLSTSFPLFDFPGEDRCLEMVVAQKAQVRSWPDSHRYPLGPDSVNFGASTRPLYQSGSPCGLALREH